MPPAERESTQMIWILVHQFAYGACETTVESTVIDEATTEALAALADLEEDRFASLADQLPAQVACAHEVLPPPTAASVHRVIGLRAALAGEDDKAEASFSAAKALDPSFVFSEDLVHPDHPIAQSYRDLAGERTSFSAMRAPRIGDFYVDGTASDKRPKETAAVVQLLDPKGAILGAGYLLPTDQIFDYQTGKKKRRGLSIALFAGSAAAGIAAGVLFGDASRQLKTYNDPATPYEETDAIRAEINTKVIASGVLAGVGTGLVIGGAVAW